MDSLSKMKPEFCFGGPRPTGDLKMIALAGTINEIFPEPGCHLVEKVWIGVDPATGKDRTVEWIYPGDKALKDCE